MAGPHVVGVVALLWSARPQLVRDIAATKAILENTANPAVTVSRRRPAAARRRRRFRTTPSATGASMPWPPSTPFRALPRRRPQRPQRLRRASRRPPRLRRRPRRRRDADKHENSDADRITVEHAVEYTHTDPDSDADDHTDCHAHENSHEHAHQHAHQHAHEDSHEDAHGHATSDADQDGHADRCCGDRHADADPQADRRSSAHRFPRRAASRGHRPWLRPGRNGTHRDELHRHGRGGGDTWITAYDTTPADDTVKDLFGNVTLTADVLIHSYNNRKGAGLLALFNEDTGKKGLALVIYDSGNSDSLTLGTVNKATGVFTAVKTVSLGGNILENAWYRLTMDVVVTGANVTVTGKVFRHATPTDPNSALGAQVGTTLSFSGARPAGVDATGEIGMAAAAFGAMADSSVANFTINP